MRALVLTAVSTAMSVSALALVLCISLSAHAVTPPQAGQSQSVLVVRHKPATTTGYLGFGNEYPATLQAIRAAIQAGQAPAPGTAALQGAGAQQWWSSQVTSSVTQPELQPIQIRREELSPTSSRGGSGNGGFNYVNGNGGGPNCNLNKVGRKYDPQLNRVSDVDKMILRDRYRSAANKMRSMITNLERKVAAPCVPGYPNNPIDPMFGIGMEKFAAARDKLYFIDQNLNTLGAIGILRELDDVYGLLADGFTNHRMSQTFLATHLQGWFKLGSSNTFNYYYDIEWLPIGRFKGEFLELEVKADDGDLFLWYFDVIYSDGFIDTFFDIYLYEDFPIYLLTAHPFLDLLQGEGYTAWGRKAKFKARGVL